MRALLAVVLVLAVVVVHWPREAFAATRPRLPVTGCVVVTPAPLPATSCSTGCCRAQVPGSVQASVAGEGTTSPEPCCDHGCACGCCGGLPIASEPPRTPPPLDQVERLAQVRAPRVHTPARGAPDRPPR